MLYKDQLGREIYIDAIPKRIVSLVPSQTELLVDLDLSSSIVGVTKFCVHPTFIRKTATIVGGTKKVHFDKISALQPDIIICNKEENTKDIVEVCAEIAPVWVSDIVSVKANNDMILSLGAICNRNEKAQLLVDDINNEYASFISFIGAKQSKNVAYLIWKNPYMAAGCNTFINTLLRCNNYSNIYDQVDGERYPEIAINSLKDAALVLLSSEPYPFKEKDIVEIKNELQVEVRLVDGEYFSWYGSRLKKAFTYFKTLHD